MDKNTQVTRSVARRQSGIKWSLKRKGGRIQDGDWGAEADSMSSVNPGPC
jgi:hypothetical protein